MGIEIFVRKTEDGEYDIFYGHEHVAHVVESEMLKDAENLQTFLRNNAYGYYHFVNNGGSFNKPTKVLKRTTNKATKQQGIIRDIVDIFW